MLHQRECIVWWIVLAVAVSEVCLAQETEPVTVVRDLKGDMVILTRKDGVCVNGRCPKKAPTYLVGEEIPCVDKVEAQGDCNLQLVPRLAIDTFSTDSIQSFIAENGSLMVQEYNTSQYGVGRLFSLQGTRQRGSNCRVTGLTLLRGNRALPHQGFSVTSGREITIVVNEEHLANPKEDYDGEVFRMNISCTDNSQVNCVVFKLNGTTNLTKGKFGGNPRMLTFTNYCDIPSPTPTTTPPTTANSGEFNSLPDVFNDPLLRYIMIGSGAGIVILVCLICTICVGICCLSARRKRNMGSFNVRDHMMNQEEEHYQLNLPLTSSVMVEAIMEETNPVPAEEAEPQDEDHTYAMVEDAQGEAEEVKRKEVRNAKFQYASITFDTFKPKPTLYQPEMDEEQMQRRRLPSFARNYNPVANRAMLARSYEVVTPMANIMAAGEGGTGGEEPSAQEIDEYDTLMHKDRKMTGTSQRNFSISTKAHVNGEMGKTIYSQLQMATKAASTNTAAAASSSTKSHPPPPPPSSAKKPQEDQEDKGLRVKTIKPQVPDAKPVPEAKPATTKTKPTIKKRTNAPKPEKPLTKVPSYSTVHKPKPPTLPPRIDEDQLGEVLKEGLYNVPKSTPKMVIDDESNVYDKPSKVIRAAKSCENIGRQQQGFDVEYQNTSSSRVNLEASYALYDMPSSSPPTGGVTAVPGVDRRWAESKQCQYGGAEFSFNGFVH